MMVLFGTVCEPVCKVFGYIKADLLHSLLKRRFYGTAFRIGSLWHPCKDVCNKSCVLDASGDFPVQLVTSLPDWSVGRLLWCSAAHLSVCWCRSSKSTQDLLRTSSWGYHEDAMWMLRGKLLLWNLSLTK